MILLRSCQVTSLPASENAEKLEEAPASLGGGHRGPPAHCSAQCPERLASTTIPCVVACISAEGQTRQLRDRRRRLGVSGAGRDGCQERSSAMRESVPPARRPASFRNGSEVNPAGDPEVATLRLKTREATQPVPLAPEGSFLWDLFHDAHLKIQFSICHDDNRHPTKKK